MKASQTFRIFLRLLQYISRSDKYALIRALALAVVCSFIEIYVLSSLGTFLSLLAGGNSSVLSTELFDAKISIRLSGLIFVLLVCLSSFLRLLSVKVNSNVSARIGSHLSHQAFNNVLRQSFRYNLANHSSLTLSLVTKHTDLTVALINQLLLLCTSSLLFIGILAGMLFTYFTASSIFLSVYIVSYLSLYLFTRHRLLKNSQVVESATRAQIKKVQEALHSVKDIIFRRAFATFLGEYKEVDIKLKSAQADNVYISALPKFILEGVGIFSLVGTLLFFSASQKGSTIVSAAGVLAIASQRILSVMQISFSCWSTIKGFSASIEKVIGALDLSEYYTTSIDSHSDCHFISEIKTIEFDCVSFRYSSSQHIFSKLSLVIPKGDYIGILGESGAGKSTFLDLITGLQSPDSGKILINGKHDISNMDILRCYHSEISIVPQDVRLIDGTLAENIAFGINPSNIDWDHLLDTVEASFLTDFIGKLPSGLLTRVGELGSKLSGGQRQRIAIARALYRNCSILILDEATSSLDLETERLVLETINSLRPSLTIVSVAHRHSALVHCDYLLEIVGGKMIRRSSLQS